MTPYSRPTQRWLTVLGLVALAATAAHAETPAPAGSAAFCLFPLAAENGSQRWVNLGIVQYVEVREGAVIMSFGGGNFGSGYEARFPVKTREEAQDILNRMRQAAQDCTRRPPAPEAARQSGAG